MHTHVAAPKDRIDELSVDVAQRIFGDIRACLRPNGLVFWFQHSLLMHLYKHTYKS